MPGGSTSISGRLRPADARRADGLGDETLELTEYLAPRGRPIPPDFAQQRPLVPAHRDHRQRHGPRLRLAAAAQGRHASTGPQRLPDWNTNAGGIRAFYFKDPDGMCSKILQFPPGKGDPKWHGRRDRLFLGIDHTAIVVSDTDASLALLSRHARAARRRRERELRRPSRST